MFKLIDETNRRQFEQMLAKNKGKRIAVVGSVTPWLGTDIAHGCKRCGTSVYIRPYVSQAISEGKVDVFCEYCVDRNKLQERISERTDELVEGMSLGH